MNIGIARRELLVEPILNPAPDDELPEPAPSPSGEFVVGGPEDPGAASPARV